jgi:hypothetical protein
LAHEVSVLDDDGGVTDHPTGMSDSDRSHEVTEGAGAEALAVWAGSSPPSERQTAAKIKEGLAIEALDSSPQAPSA